MDDPEPSREEQVERIRMLEERLREAEQTIEAIQNGEIDALVIHRADEEKVYTLTGADHGYRVLVESIAEGALILSPDDSIYYCNCALEDMLGATAKTLITAKLDTHIAAEGRTRWAELVKTARAYGVARDELLLTRNGGSPVPVNISLNRVHFEDFMGICAVITDLSMQKEMEGELRRSRDELEVRVRELNEKSANLEELNIALKVLLKQREEDQKELSEMVLTNVRNLVLPFLDKLKTTQMSSTQSTLVEILESHLGEITSTFTRKLGIEAADLTPTELRIASFIRNGKSTTDIAGILCIAEKTVCSHRDNIRKKLGLRGNRGNLRAHLLALA